MKYWLRMKKEKKVIIEIFNNNNNNNKLGGWIKAKKKRVMFKINIIYNSKQYIYFYLLSFLIDSKKS